ncbi:MAG: EamA family transporter [Bacteroidetes bacterium]|nr:EamA family transporter [Bacteroidota bacterium]
MAEPEHSEHIANNPGKEISHHGLLLLFTFFWGANFILAEIALREMAPISFSVSRFAMGGIAMLAVLYAQCYADAKHTGTTFQFFPKIDKKDWMRLLWVSVLGATLAPWLGIEGLGLTHGARASIWLETGPAVSTGFGYILSTEKMGKVGYFGVVLAGLGTLTLAYDGLFVEQGYWTGDMLLFIALVLTVVELHLIKPLARKYGSVSMVAMRTVIGGTLYLLIASPSLAQESWMSLGMWAWIAILAGGAVGVGVGQWVKVRALRLLGPTQVVIYGNLVPIAALIIAWLSIGKNPSLYEIIAGLLVIVGAICIQVIDASQTPHKHTQQDDELSVVSSAKQD